uniref:Uncharacterized protein n=1 Tax=Panagrolaimus davidi TaxID=227884 RepID=A0A914QIT3_9BILA
MLIAANISANFGEFVLVQLTADKFDNMVELKYTKAGYELVRHQSIHDMDEGDEELGEKILGTNELQKIVFFYRLVTFALGDDNYHEYEITLKVDVHDQPSYAVRGIIVQQIIDFPSLCNEKMDDEDYAEDEEKFEKYPVIGFYGNHSFI